MKVTVIYYSRGGTTKKMAEIIGNEIARHSVEVSLKSVEQVDARELLEYDGIIVGSPTYYGNMASQIKELFDQSVSFHSKLDGKIGGAFSSSANLAGGNETTIMAILEAMLIHGMIIQGDAKGDHYGPVAVGKVTSLCEENCQRFAARFAGLLKKVKGKFFL